ncbi:MAG: diacylglycerol kinase family protein [Planctomycetota bacterium]
MEYAVLYNPVAGRGRAVPLAEEARAFLEARGHVVHDARSERAGHVEELAAAFGPRVDRVLVLGGDGSLREAAAGLVGRDGTRPRPRAALGVLPMGSGNVVARELGLPLEPRAALEAIEGGGERPFDLGVADTADGPEPFLAMCGVGFDAEVAAAVDRTRRGRWGGRLYRRSGDLVYGAVGLCRLAFGRREPLGVELDGDALAGDVASLVVCNARVYGKGMVLTPDAVPDDGVLDVHLQRARSAWGMATTLVQAQRRRPIPAWAAEARRAHSVRIRTRGVRECAWQLDGDPMGGAAALDLRIVPGALRLLAGGGASA